MSAQELIRSLEMLEQEALEAFANSTSPETLEETRIQYLGAKQGRLRELQKQIPRVPESHRPAAGKRFNEVSRRVKAAYEQARQNLTQPTRTAAPFDVTLPGRKPRIGHRHPITQTAQELVEIMARLGFSLAEGPEVEDEWHNFEALNIPVEHPARDPLDNFYLAVAQKQAKAGRSSSPPATPMLLRSQTSTVQIRVMEAVPPPIRVIALGRCYRPDTVDATHSFMFHQIEGLMVDTDVTMADLKTVLHLLAAAYLGEDVRIRFRPSFFPFTEPSVEVDMSWGRGGNEWIELGGAGMVDPNVFHAVNRSREQSGREAWYDPEKYTGFAFGLGIERLAMRRHGIDDIRLFFENDVRFLRQF